MWLLFMSVITGATLQSIQVFWPAVIARTTTLVTAGLWVCTVGVVIGLAVLAKLYFRYR